MLNFTPVPEPSTWAMMASGLCALGGRRSPAQALTLRPAFIAAAALLAASRVRPPGDAGGGRDRVPDASPRQRRRARGPGPAGRHGLHGPEHPPRALRGADRDRREDLAGRARRRPVMGGVRRRAHLDVPPEGGPALVERRAAHGGRLRPVVEADALPRPRLRIRLPPLPDPECGGLQPGHDLRRSRARASPRRTRGRCGSSSQRRRRTCRSWSPCPPGIP